MQLKGTDSGSFSLFVKTMRIFEVFRDECADVASVRSQTFCRFSIGIIHLFLALENISEHGLGLFSLGGKNNEKRKGMLKFRGGE